MIFSFYMHSNRFKSFQTGNLCSSVAGNFLELTIVMSSSPFSILSGIIRPLYFYVILTLFHFFYISVLIWKIQLSVTLLCFISLLF